uniref:Exonuclease 1 n=1 Tax=Phallusia mammillata TaxID=59560 RepID=A0A6F9D730_9ASCI|nr:exonuclease 1-like [Phallusia mammillata]
MGIQGLHRFVRDAVDDIHIKKYAGKQIAVDTYCWIHRGCFACADKLAKKEKTDQYVKYCLKYVEMLEKYKIKPILVFDGCHLPSKSQVEEQRGKRRKENLERGRQLLREGNLSAARDCFTKCISVTPSMALEVMNAMRNRGVDCIVAPYEADAQLAFFSKNNYVEAIITEDSDLLCFGSKKVIFKLDLCGRGQEVALENLGRVKNLVGFTPDLFRQMCILSGCDYLPSVKGVGVVKACKAIKLSKSKDSYQVARKLHQYIKGIQPVEASYGPNFERADKTFLYQLVFDPYKRRLIPLSEYPEGTTAEDVKFAGAVFPKDVAMQIALGNIDVGTMQTVASFNVDKWVRTRKSASSMPSIWAKNSLVVSKFNVKESETFNEPTEEQTQEVEKSTPVETPELVTATDALAVIESDAPDDLAQKDDAKSGLRKFLQGTVKSSDSETITKSRFFKTPKKQTGTDNSGESSNLSNNSFGSIEEESIESKPSDADLTDIVSDVINQYLEEDKHLTKRKNPFTRTSQTKRPCPDKISCKSPNYKRKKKLFRPAAVINDDVNSTNEASQNFEKNVTQDLNNEDFEKKISENLNSEGLGETETLDLCENNVELETSQTSNNKGTSGRTPLSQLPDPNGKDDIPTVTISSDEEKTDSQKQSIKKSRVLGLGRKVGKSKTSVVSKYFGSAKASGLRKKTQTPQQVITSFFKKLDG